MDALPMNVLDLAVAVVVVLAGLLGLAVGFVRGVLFVLCWVGAIVATVYGFPSVQPVARRYIESPLFADVTAGLSLFIVTLVVLFVVSVLIGGLVKDSRLNALDRSLGFVSAMAAAAVVLCLVYIPLESIYPPAEQPDWARDARVMPLIESGANFIRSQGIANFDGTGAKVDDTIRKMNDAVTQKAFETLASPPPKGDEQSGRSGYNAGERNDMDRLFQQQDQ